MRELLTEKEKKRLIANIAKACLRKDNSLLTSKSIEWIESNCVLMPRECIRYNDMPIKSKSNRIWLEEFLRNLDLFDFITSDYAINYRLDNINGWINKGLQYSMDSLFRFSEFCFVINVLRVKINIREFSVHYSINSDGRKWKRFNRRVAAYDLNHASKQLKRYYTSTVWDGKKTRRWDALGKIHSIRNLHSVPLFMIQKNRVNEKVWEELTKYSK